MPPRILLLPLLLLAGCAMSGGSPADPGTMRTLYEAQCRKGSAFACEKAEELRGDRPQLEPTEPTTTVRLNRVGMQLTVQASLNTRSDLPFQLAPTDVENTMPTDIYETMRRFHLLGDADVIGQAGPGAAPVVLVRSMHVGARHLMDVPFRVVSSDGRLSLGAPFFTRFKAWNIDPRRRVMHLE